MKIKDVIYGEIEITDSYIADLINCCEFQRLKNITQNGFSFLDFPTLKNNSRFSHSIGAFYVFCKILNKLEKELGQYKIKLSDRAKAAAKVAILLHDIGHGPFSHMFEMQTGISHEERGKQILLGNTEINKVLRNHFGGKTFNGNFAVDVCNLVYAKNFLFGEKSAMPILHQFISGEIDADRLDYIRRDNYYTGRKNMANTDEIIESIKIGLSEKGKPFVYYSDDKQIRNLLLNRQSNYNDIYLAKNSIIFEYKIFSFMMPKIINSLKSDKLVFNMLSFDFLNAISNLKNLNTFDFLNLNDKTFFDAFKTINQNSKNALLKYLTSDGMTNDFIKIDANKYGGAEKCKEVILKKYFGSTTPVPHELAGFFEIDKSIRGTDSKKILVHTKGKFAPIENVPTNSIKKEHYYNKTLTCLSSCFHFEQTSKGFKKINV